MNKSITINPLQRSDIPVVKQIIDRNQMFPPDMIDGMVEPFFQAECSEFWQVARTEQPVAVAYCAPEPMTEGTWNLLLIAVVPEQHGSGIGRQLIESVETHLRQLKARVLLVDTSGLPEYEKTRAFYPQCGFVEVARIHDYYEDGDDKVTFWKHLKR